MPRPDMASLLHGARVESHGRRGLIGGIDAIFLKMGAINVVMLLALPHSPHSGGAP